MKIFYSIFGSLFTYRFSYTMQYVLSVAVDSNGYVYTYESIQILYLCILVLCTSYVMLLNIIYALKLIRWGFGGYGRLVLVLQFLVISEIWNGSRRWVLIWSHWRLYTQSGLVKTYSHLLTDSDIGSRRMSGSLVVLMSFSATMFYHLMLWFPLVLSILHVLQVIPWACQWTFCLEILIF